MNIKWGAVTLAGALLLTACSSDASESQPAPTSTAPEGAIGWVPTRDVIDTKELPDGSSYSLESVERLADDRVIVYGWLKPSEDPLAQTRTYGERLMTPGVSEYGLRVPGDEREYLPVRDPLGQCLCSTAGIGGGPWFVTAVVSAPAGATSAHLRLGGFEFADVPITPMETSNRTVYGVDSSVLEVHSAARENGFVSVSGTMSFTRSDVSSELLDEFEQTPKTVCLAPYFVIGTDGIASGGIERSSTCIEPPPTGGSTNFTSKMEDPGGENLVILPRRGRAISVPVTGSPPAEPATKLKYGFRHRVPGALLQEFGRQLLEGEVIFNNKTSELSPAAAKTLAATAEALRARPEREFTVVSYVPRDRVAEDATDVAEAQAIAVQTELVKLLGPGWTIHHEAWGLLSTASEYSNLITARDTAGQQTVEIRVGAPS